MVFIRPAKLSHVALRNSNLGPMAKFYTDLLGAQCKLLPNVAFLRTDDELLRLAIIQIPNTANKNAQSNGLEHFAFSFDSLEDLITMYKQRKEFGILPYRVVHHGPSMSFYYYDPDGNKVELQMEFITTEEQFRAFAATGGMDKNPVGVEMKPEDIVAKVEAGEAASLVERPDIGTRGFEHIM